MCASGYWSNTTEWTVGGGSCGGMLRSYTNIFKRHSLNLALLDISYTRYMCKYKLHLFYTFACSSPAAEGHISRFRLRGTQGVRNYIATRLDLSRAAWHMIWTFKVKRARHFSRNCVSRRQAAQGPWKPTVCLLIPLCCSAVASNGPPSSVRVAVTAKQ